MDLGRLAQKNVPALPLAWELKILSRHARERQGKRLVDGGGHPT
jgi:hypothetical protein